MMGPGFAEEVGRMMTRALIAAAVVVLLIGVAIGALL